MAYVITAPEPFEKDRPGIYCQSIFLAGPIDMGAAVDWQSRVIERLKYSEVTIVNPRRKKFDESTLDEQIYWELQALEDVDFIFMWFPKDAKASISFLETGLYMRSTKLLIGAELGFRQRRCLEITCNRFGKYLYESFDAMINVFK